MRCIEERSEGKGGAGKPLVEKYLLSLKPSQQAWVLLFKTIPKVILIFLLSFLTQKYKYLYELTSKSNMLKYFGQF